MIAETLINYFISQRSDSTWVVMKSVKVGSSPPKTTTISGPFYHKIAAEGERDALQKGGE